MFDTRVMLRSKGVTAMDKSLIMAVLAVAALNFVNDRYLGIF